MLRVCSLQVTPTEFSTSQNDILQIFTNMLDEKYINNLHALSYTEFPIGDRKAMFALLYDKLLETITQIIEKLDLGVQKFAADIGMILLIIWNLNLIYINLFSQTSRTL